MSRILIIEDENKMALGLKDNLEYEGHEVQIAGDGETGLRMALHSHPHLIILDIMLPRKSGFDVCRDLRAKSVSGAVRSLLPACGVIQGSRFGLPWVAPFG